MLDDLSVFALLFFGGLVLLLPHLRETGITKKDALEEANRCLKGRYR